MSPLHLEFKYDNIKLLYQCVNTSSESLVMGSSHDVRATMPSTATIRPIREESKENKLGEWVYENIEGFFNGAGLCKKRCSVLI